MINHEKEKDLLTKGFTYQEISKLTGSPVSCIRSRNCTKYRVNILEARHARFKNFEIPSRLHISDSFGFWFTGFFEGEGHFRCHSYHSNNGGYLIKRISVMLVQRSDNGYLLDYIQENLKCGILFKDRKSTLHPQDRWECSKIDDLQEIIVPLFSQYPIIGKKKSEFQYWKELVKMKYLNKGKGIYTPDENNKFLSLEQKIRDCRSFTHPSIC